MTAFSGPLVVLTGRQAAMLNTYGDLSRLRQRNEHSNDPELADLLSSLVSAANEYMVGCAAATGNRGRPAAVASSRVMTPTEAAARLGITEQAVRRALSEERLTGEKVNGRWQISADAIGEFDSRLNPHPAPADMTVRLMLHARAQAVGLDEFLSEMRDAGLRFAADHEDSDRRLAEVGVIMLHTDGTHVPYEPRIPGRETPALPAHGSGAGK